MYFTICIPGKQKGKNVYRRPEVYVEKIMELLWVILSRDNGGTYNLENLLWTCQSMAEDKIGPNNMGTRCKK